MSKNIVIYHASCADGFASAYAAWKRFGGEAEYISCQYNTHMHKTGEGLPDMSGADVYILDFSFPGG